MVQDIRRKKLGKSESKFRHGGGGYQKRPKISDVFYGRPHSAQRPNIERDLNWQRLTDNNLLTLKAKVVMVLQFQVKYNIMYFSFQRDVITIWFTLTGSSDIWNWVCLFLCLVLASFGTFCSKFQVKWNIKMRNRHKFDNCLMTVCSVLLLGIDTEVL